MYKYRIDNDSCYQWRCYEFVLFYRYTLQMLYACCDTYSHNAYGEIREMTIFFARGAKIESA